MLSISYSVLVSNYNCIRDTIETSAVIVRLWQCRADRWWDTLGAPQETIEAAI